MNPKLTPDRLHRRAIVYIRQSTPGQLIHNQESQRRQYGLVNQARELGFPEVIVIDDDLGRTGSGWSSALDSNVWSRSLHRRGERCLLHRGFALGTQRSRLAST